VEIIDIPAQLSKAFSYSGRSWKGFGLSVLLGMLATGVIFDLAYGFFYQRIYNAEHVYYGSRYWVTLAGVSVLLPCAFAVGSVAWWRFQARHFRGEKFGIAIAPFEVVSVHVDTMSTSDKLQALDEAIQQFFAATQQVLHEEEWAPNFDFRMLPANVRVRDQQEAAAKFKAMGATLLIWGQVIQENELQMRMRLTGIELNMTFTGPVSPLFLSPSLKLWSLMAAFMVLKQKGAFREAEQYLDLALVPARQVDAQARGAVQGQPGASEQLLQQAHGWLKAPASPTGGATAS
jgi:hypothetical protein